ncbi:hypothetical protein [Parabacteroides sp.]
MNKSIFILTMMSLTSFVLFSSCGGSKNAPVASYPEYTSEGKAKANVVTKVDDTDECENAVLECPPNEFRAYGSAISVSRDLGRTKVISRAKNQLISDLSALILSVVEDYVQEYIKDKNFSLSESTKRYISSVSERMLENNNIVCNKTYLRSDGNYECIVCISIQKEDVENIAEDAAISESEKMKIDFDKETFLNSQKDKIDRYRKQKGMND